MQIPLQNPPKGSSQPEGEQIKKDKGKKAMSSEEAEKESTNSDSDDETHVTGSMVETSRIKKLKKFDFITKDGKHIHLTEDQIYQQKKIEEEAKAEAAKQEGEVRKVELVDLLGAKVGPITLKVYKEDGTSEVIPNFKASDLHLGEWREVVKACPNRTRKGWKTIYGQIQTRMDYLHTTEAELGINLDIPLTNKRLKSSVQYEDHLPGTVLNEPVLGMIMFNSYHRQDFVTIEDLKDFSNTMLYTVQEIFFRRHQGSRLDDHARTFSSLLLAKVDKRNQNPLKQKRVIEQFELLKFLQRQQKDLLRILNCGESRKIESSALQKRIIGFEHSVRWKNLSLSRSHTSTIRNLILRVVHKMITYGLCQRTTGYDKVKKNDLWLLGMFDARHQNGYANVAWVIAKWMKREGAETQKESQILCGQFILKLARKSGLLNEMW
ncbi:hypothetical protein Tco_0808528 [Tanacetum coccineum]